MRMIKWRENNTQSYDAISYTLKLLNLWISEVNETGRKCYLHFIAGEAEENHKKLSCKYEDITFYRT
jgi:hypothetical protein